MLKMVNPHGCLLSVSDFLIFSTVQACFDWSKVSSTFWCVSNLRQSCWRPMFVLLKYPDMFPFSIINMSKIPMFFSKNAIDERLMIIQLPPIVKLLVTVTFHSIPESPHMLFVNIFDTVVVICYNIPCVPSAYYPFSWRILHISHSWDARPCWSFTCLSIVNFKFQVSRILNPHFDGSNHINALNQDALAMIPQDAIYT